MKQLFASFFSPVENFFSKQWSIFLDNLSLLELSTFQIVVDVFVIAMLFFMIIKWVRGTRALQVIMGIIVLGVIYVISVIFELIALNALFRIFFPALVIAIPILFQQELRRGLEHLGQKGIFARHRTKELSDVIQTIVEAVKTIRTKKKGALLVFEKFVSLKEWIDTGVMLNAQLTQELILSIFLSKAPLHDGAVILRGDKIISAGSVLPLSEGVKTMDYGTRHKAALGLAEISDAFIIVVSEEKKEISVAYQGKLTSKLSPERLSSMLLTFFKPHASKSSS